MSISREAFFRNQNALSFDSKFRYLHNCKSPPAGGRTFPLFSPNIESIELNKVGRVRRAKLYFQRERSGKSARIKEKRQATE